jgi:hypothetical protein
MADDQTPLDYLPATKKFLAIGSRKTLKEFLAFFMLYLLHGDELACYYVDENNVDPTLIDQIGFERVYALNCKPQDFNFLVRSGELVFMLENTPNTVPGDVEVINYQTQGDQMFFEKTFHHRLVTYKRSAHHEFPMTSILAHALFYVTNRVWFGEGSITVVPFSSYYPVTGVLAKNVQAFMMVMESLPTFASLASAKFYEALDQVPRTSFAPMYEFLMSDPTKNLG